MKSGYLFAFITYIFWGLSPLYWKVFQDFTTSEVLSHRIIWSLGFTVFILLLQKRFNLLQKLRQPKLLRTYVFSAFLLVANWFIYLFAVANDFIIESSLGYFITPLINVFLGYVVLKERLRLWQWVAIALCCVGVVFRTVTYGSLPIIALSLAISFGIYGLIRKQAPLDAIEGLALESALIVIPAILFNIYLLSQGTGHFFNSGIVSPALLISAGFYTAVPLIFFAAAAKRLELGILGLLMYINPTLQFLIGRFVFNEAFDQNGLIAFSIIWIALILFTVESYAFSKHGARSLKQSTL